MTTDQSTHLTGPDVRGVAGGRHLGVPAASALAPNDDLTAAAVPLLATHDEAVAAAHGLAGELAPGAADRDRAGTVPWAELARLDRSGLLGIGVPSELGGADLGARTLAEVIRVIAAADPAIAQVPQAHFVFSLALWELGSADARRQLADAVLAGERIGNAVAERGGAHAQDLRTRLTPDAATLRLTGTKYYCTGAISSAWIAVTAIDDTPDERLQLAFVRRDAPGVEVRDDWSVIGQRSTVSGTTVFDDVAVDRELVVPYWSLFEAPQTLGARAQLVHAAIEVGIAGGALADAARFLRERARPFFEAVRGGYTETAAGDPHTVHRFGQLATRVAAAEALLRDAAAALDRVPLRPAAATEAAEASLAVARAKAFGSEVAVEVASDLFALAGASAADAKHGLDRHWRNARTHSVHDPVSWKYHHVGAYAIDGTLPPNHGQL